MRRVCWNQKLSFSTAESNPYAHACPFFYYRYAVGAIFPQTGETLYRNMAWVGTLVSSALFVFALFIPRSPRWLTNRGQVDSARKALVFLRGENYDVEEEIEEMKASQARADAEGKASLSELFSGATLKAMGVMTGLMLFQQLSGINSVIFFSGKIFAIAGLTNATLASVILGAVQVSMPLFALTHRVSRFSRLAHSEICVAFFCRTVFFCVPLG